MFFNILLFLTSSSNRGFFRGIIFNSSAYEDKVIDKIIMNIFVKNVILFAIIILLNESLNYVISIYV